MTSAVDQSPKLSTEAASQSQTRFQDKKISSLASAIPLDKKIWKQGHPGYLANDRGVEKIGKSEEFAKNRKKEQNLKARHSHHILFSLLDMHLRREEINSKYVCAKTYLLI